MAGYIGSKASVVSSGAERKKTFAITASTTSLTGLVYTPNMVHVFHNGIRLVDGTDYTATNGTTITLTNAAANGDEVVVVNQATFQTSDTVSASAGGTFSNDVNFSTDVDVTGDVTVGGAFTSQGIDDNATSASVTIDSAGRVTMPYQPVFKAQGGTSYTKGTGLGVVTFAAANPNVGSHYSTTNGRFTAPVAGNYFFSSQVRVDNADVSYFRIHIRKNGTVSYEQPHSIYDLGTNFDPRYFSMSASGIIPLAINDYVEVVIDSHTDTSHNVHPNESMFSGYLIG